ncbi:MAG: HNH endonuclease [Candidatus Eremiobacteraeota bacterium]|nr:HNH endonuclease [Candidatus Eremiobacteraeota bacterium]
MSLRAGILAVCLIAVSAPGASIARGHHSSYRGYRTSSHHHRSLREKHLFWRDTGYPHGRPGYIVDHVVPLACGGADAPGNMQWQTKAAARAKDRWERKGCNRR